MGLWYECGNGLIRLEKSFARSNLGADAYLCCPGPSLANVKDSDLHIPGAMIFGLNTSYPHIKPNVWIGMDGTECYDRNLWWEPFIKICRGGYPNMMVGNYYIKNCPNVYFADIEKGTTEDIFKRRAHNTNFVWVENTFVVAMHIMVWMGAKTINLVGTDFGGGKDYYDDRVLADDKKARNAKLYSQQVKFVKTFANFAKKYGITVNSCTPNSPINEFVPYIDLQDALNKSKSKVPSITSDILYSTDAEYCRWWRNPKHEKGVMVGCAKVHEDLIPWWINNYKKYNNYPLAFADFGISEKYKEICKSHGQLIDVTKIPVEGWFRKPSAILKAPFKKIIWCDTDIEIRRNMEEIFSYSNNKKIGVGWDSYNPESFRNNLHKDAKLWDSGLISVQHGNTTINSWAQRTLTAAKNQYAGDHEILSIILWENNMPINEIPKHIHKMRLDKVGNDNRIISLHWTGSKGKEIIRDKIKELYPNDNKTAVITLNIGDKYKDVFSITGKSIESYAKRIGADYIVIDNFKLNVIRPGEDRPTPHFEKFQMYDIINNYDRIAYFDADILIKDDCPNIFDVVPSDSVGVFNECIDQIVTKTSDLREIKEVQEKYGNVGWKENFYFNSGVIVASKEHKKLFEFNMNRFWSKHFKDQTMLNHNLQIYKFKTYELPDIYNKLVKQYKDVSDAYVLHYAGFNSEDTLRRINNAL